MSKMVTFHVTLDHKRLVIANTMNISKQK